ncbi:MAG: Zinc/iron permease [Monoraphidium minutum]|nr:MAG: Zinc/iron permease [Monoraphidium minutum]
MLTARRALLGLGHLHGGAHKEEEAEDHSDHGMHEGGGASTLDVRIVAIFAIAAGALLCGLPPLFLRAFQSPDAPVARVARAFSGGIILALALVHIIPEAIMELDGVLPYPIGGVTVLFGIIALVITDSTLTALWAPKDYKDQLLADSGAAPPRGSASATVRALKPACGHSHAAGGRGHAHARGGEQQQQHGHSHGHNHSDDGSSGSDDALAAVKDVAPHAAMVTTPAPPKGAPPPTARELAAAAGEAAAAGAHAPHTHACTSSLSAQRWLGGGGGALDGVKQRVTAYTMELGCIFHSVIIGVGVGVITDDRQLVIVLMVALIVHQGLEGMSLGTVIALTHFSRAKKVAMVCLYGFTTSIGIAIGIAVASTYDAGSVASRAVQGTLNGVSGGMLLYISMFQLIAEEFSREDLLVKGRLRAAVTAGLLLGAACMCVLAVWS